MSTVTYIDHMGSDIDVVNAARVSFDKESEPLEWGSEVVSGLFRHPVPRPILAARDMHLIHYLARGMSRDELASIVDAIVDLCEVPAGERDTARARVREQLRRYRQRPLHWSPFAHVILKVRVRAPFAIARQLETHQIGLAANEVSRRYVDDAPEVFEPLAWRLRAENRKQGSGAAVRDADLLEEVHSAYRDATGVALTAYRQLLEMGVAPEQARFALPVGTYTEWIWTGSLMAFARVCQQRLDDHAQDEVRQVAAPLAMICETLWPVSWQALRAF